MIKATLKDRYAGQDEVRFVWIYLLNQSHRHREYACESPAAETVGARLGIVQI